ncbi:MAG: DUF4149 domain-containing protein [Pseudomonadota bacterium]
MLRFQLLLAVVWVGSLWTVGYLVAPTLFVTLHDRVLAGTIAGSMFATQAWVSVVCAALMFGVLRGEGDARRRRSLNAIVLAMLACALTMRFGLQPMLAALREAAGPGGVMDSALRTRFGVLHGASSLFYLVESVLGGWMLYKLSAPPQ